jgi:hypothetical protein
VKNWRDQIGLDEVGEILKIVELARDKYKKRIIQPAIVASYAYRDLIEGVQSTVPIALLEKQVAPESCQELCESLNDKLAFDFEITDKPTDKMRENIEKYICKHDYERDQQPTKP